VKRQLTLLLRLLRPHPGLVARFAVTSLARAALTAASILLIREFLTGVITRAQPLVQGISVEASLFLVVGLLLFANLAAAAFQVSVATGDARQHDCENVLRLPQRHDVFTAVDAARAREK